MIFLCGGRILQFNYISGWKSKREKYIMINFGGPSESTCTRNSSGYTVDSGVMKPLSLSNLQLLQTSSAIPIVKTDLIVLYTCALANDDTSLKPAIEYDQFLKENVGLSFNMDLNYINSNPLPSPEQLKESIITEALVSSVTSLDNNCSSPCAVEFSTKTGKKGEAIMETFTSQIKILQMCLFCQKNTEPKDIS